MKVVLEIGGFDERSFGTISFSGVPIGVLPKLCEAIPEMALKEYLVSRTDRLELEYGKEWVHNLLESIKGMNAKDALVKIDEEEKEAEIRKLNG